MPSQKVSRTEIGNPEVVTRLYGLRSLAGAWRPEHDDIHRARVETGFSRLEPLHLSESEAFAPHTRAAGWRTRQWAPAKRPAAAGLEFPGFVHGGERRRRQRGP